MSKRPQNLDAGGSQLNLFDYLRHVESMRHEADSDEGSMNIRERLRHSLNLAIRECRLSRSQIAGEMSHLLGVDVTKSMIDAWTAESKDNYRIPAEYLPAFCRVTDCNRPIEILTETAGMFSMPGPDALRSEIQKYSEMESRARSEKRKRQIFLEEMIGKG